MASIRIVLRPARRRRRRRVLPGIWRDVSPCALRGSSLLGKSWASFSRRCWAASPFEAEMPLPAQLRVPGASRRAAKIA